LGRIIGTCHDLVRLEGRAPARPPEGLGLAIVRRIAEELDGQVGVTSEVGKGSWFWFELPAAAAAG
jgi:light-regulated signal transduction histidine kinase (bacteriophytochrome)